MKILALGTSCVDVYPQKDLITPDGEALNIAAQLSYRSDVQVFLMGVIGKGYLRRPYFAERRQFFH